MEQHFSPQELEFYKRILENIPGEKIIKSETDADALCPVHSDTNPSLGVDLRRNGAGAKVVLNCRSQGCGFEDVLKAANLKGEDLYFSANGYGQHDQLPGCTLEDYANAKMLPLDFLTSGEIGLEQITYVGVPAIYVPYPDIDGTVVSKRFRTALEKNQSGPDNRFRWRKGDSPLLYGLHRLSDAVEAGYVLLVEGESDCHVAWYHGIPAVGVPGAKNWNDEWTVYFDEIPTVLVTVEPDEAGESLWRKVSSCASFEGRIRKVILP